MVAIEIRREKYVVEVDDPPLARKIDGFYFTIHNRDFKLFTYLWSVIFKHITGTQVLGILRKLHEALWIEGMQYFLRSEETLGILKNLNDKSSQFVMEEMSGSHFFDGSVEYLHCLEDEVEQL